MAKITRNFTLHIVICFDRTPN